MSVKDIEFHVVPSTLQLFVSRMTNIILLTIVSYQTVGWTLSWNNHLVKLSGPIFQTTSSPSPKFEFKVIWHDIQFVLPLCSSEVPPLLLHLGGKLTGYPTDLLLKSRPVPVVWYKDDKQPHLCLLLYRPRGRTRHTPTRRHSFDSELHLLDHVIFINNKGYYSSNMNPPTPTPTSEH